LRRFASVVVSETRNFESCKEDRAESSRVTFVKYRSGPVVQTSGWYHCALKKHCEEHNIDAKHFLLNSVQILSLEFKEFLKH
jgi:hypothetical protein